MPHLDEAKAFYAAELQRYYASPPRGATEEEINALEQRLGMSLPAAYREFLLWMGDDLDGIFRGSDCFAHSVLGNTKALKDELLPENGIDLGSENPVVFFMHQGYIAAWFDRTASEPDPVISFFSEGNDKGIQTAGCFTDWLMAELFAAAQVHRELHRHN